MTWSDVLFVASTLGWCQAMPQRLLWIYATSVMATALVKHFWR